MWSLTPWYNSYSYKIGLYGPLRRGWRGRGFGFGRGFGWGRGRAFGRRFCWTIWGIPPWWWL